MEKIATFIGIVLGTALSLASAGVIVWIIAKIFCFAFSWKYATLLIIIDMTITGIKKTLQEE